MDYQEALTYIHSVSNFFCKPGLERIGILCERLGNPQDSLKFIHVAGTNGKGSFCAMISSILTDAGYKTGLYTSPYILNFNERIQIDGRQIENEALAEITARVKCIAEEMDDKPTEFEVITAVAFEYFAENECDVVVLECGLGGRFDATNIIKTSVLSVITGVSIDHTAFLGNTAESIAFEKAGIIKQNSLCLWCGDNKEAYKVISECAKEKSARLVCADRSGIKNIRYSLEGTVFDFEDIKDINLSLLGSYQPINAANVLCAIKLLKGFDIPKKSIRAGLKNVVWHSRFEIIRTDPVMIADGGHNEEGVNAAVESIRLYFPDKKVNIITGVMKDKDFALMAKKIGEIANRVFCITPDNPRALLADEYAKTFRQNGVDTLPFENLSDAVNEALKEDIPIISLGSLYMYNELINVLKNL